MACLLVLQANFKQKFNILNQEKQKNTFFLVYCDWHFLSHVDEILKCDH